MGTVRYGNKKIKKLTKVNQNFTVRGGSLETLVKKASYHSFIPTAQKVSKLLLPKRQQAINSIDEFKKYSHSAHDWCDMLWSQTQQEHYGDKHTTPPTSVCVPKSKLTKNGDINEVVAKQTLEKLSETFNLEDDQPFMIGNTLINKLIKAPKKVVAETYINAVGKHERPCFVVRKLLSCNIDGNTYMLVADEKYYQNSPTIAMPLTLLVGGEPHGIAQLARIDSIGHLGADAAAQLGITLKQPLEIPDYFEEKFNSTHHNAVPSHKKSKSSKFQSVKRIAATHHVHVRDENFELMYALCHMATKCLPVYRNQPSKFLRFNAKEVSEGELYLKEYGKIHEHNATMKYQLEMLGLLNKLKTDDILGNNSVIHTEALQEFFVKTFNISNYEFDDNFTAFLDQMRTFKPTELVKLIDYSKVIGKRKYMQVPTKPDNKLERQVKKLLNRIVDFDYIKLHPEKYEAWLDEYRTMFESNPDGGQNDEPLMRPVTPSQTTPDGGKDIK